MLLSCSAPSGGGATIERETPNTTGLPQAGGSTSSTSGGSGGTGTPVVSIGGAMAEPDDECPEVTLNFEPKTPTVYILVDRSTSMWDNQYWDNLRTGVLEIVSDLQEEVRFGLATFTGIMGQTCPLELEDAGVLDLLAYDAISTFYNATQQPGQASETPTEAAVIEIQNVLLADTFDGPKSILIVTDGNPDYCDNGDAKCRADDLVRTLQAANTAGIRSFIFALPDPAILEGWLTAFANAGGGEPVAAPEDTQYCDGGGHPTGTYSAAMGPLTYFQANPAEQMTLATELRTAVTGARSCVFDLVGQLEIDSNQYDSGVVSINGQSIPFDPTNGYRMNSPTQLEFLGTACDMVRDPMTDRLAIDIWFPCEAVIVY